VFETIFDEATTTIGFCIFVCAIILLLLFINRFLKYTYQDTGEKNQRNIADNFRTLKTLLAVVPLFIVVSLFYDDTNALGETVFNLVTPLVLLFMFLISIIEVYFTTKM
jgi:heme/copper-type cytochrome/quinol oxidase subunit 2